MKVIVIGGVAGGASTAARLRRMDELAEIIILERGPYLSYANCGLPYHIGGSIEDRSKLLVVTPQDLREQLNLDARPNQEVLDIDREAKTVTVRLEDGSSYTETYDKLVLSPGATPIVPPLPGMNLPNVFVLHNIPEMDSIIKYIHENSPQDVVVVGGGFIGLEIAENLHERGLKVTIVEMLNQVMAPIDYELAQMVHQHLALNGVKLALGDGLKAIEEQGDSKLQVQTASGKIYPADFVILAIGVCPENQLAKKAGLNLGERGHVVVDEYMCTSDPDIYAVGDVVQVKHRISGQPIGLALAGPASKQGRVAADSIAGKPREFKGVSGTSVVKVFDLTVASTGLNTRELKRLGLPFDSVTVHTNNHVSYYPGSTPVTLKLLYGPQGQIYGAQAVGQSGVEKRIDVLATAIHGDMTVFDLEDLELSYAPPYGSPRDPVNNAGFSAANALRGDSPLKHWEDLEGLNKDEWIFLDVRHPEETVVGSLPGSVNIELNHLRENLHRLPRDKKILVNCSGGQRSYFAVRVLRQSGYDAWNLSGGYKTYAAAFYDAQHEGAKHMIPDVNQNQDPQPASGQASEPLTSGKEYHVDACGLQCPGPIMRLYKQVKEMQDGDIVNISATDLGFASDVGAWAKATGNRLVHMEVKDGKILAQVQKGLTQTQKPAAGREAATDKSDKKDLTMVVFSGDLDKAIAAMIIANGFASMGQKATLFFTFWGLNILRKDQAPPVKKNLIEKMFGWMMPRGAKKLTLSQMHMMGMGTSMIKNIMKQKNVDSLPELIHQAQANGVKLLACQMTMDLMGIRQEELLDGVELAGVATMAASATDSNTHYFI